MSHFLSKWFAKKAWSWLGHYMTYSNISANTKEWNTLLEARTILLTAARDKASIKIV
jgi:hypothetical protein